jgi:hypothetical protein
MKSYFRFRDQDGNLIDVIDILKDLKERVDKLENPEPDEGTCGFCEEPCNNDWCPAKLVKEKGNE